MKSGLLHRASEHPLETQHWTVMPPHRAKLSCAEPLKAVTRRRHTQTCTAALKIHSEYLRARRCSQPLPYFMVTPRKDAPSPRASRAQPCRPHHKSASPAQKRSRRQRPCTHAKPLAGVCHCPDQRRAQLRRTRGAAPMRKSPTDPRRTFERPPSAGGERTREILERVSN